MAESTTIEWTDATVNFWWGCTKVGPGCDHCYAETWSKRLGGSFWGVGAPRRKIKSAVALIHRLDNDYSWWSADHYIGGIHATGRRRVFIQSMSDLFDTEVPVEWFDEAWGRIEICNRLAIQIVTKRISVVEKRLAAIGRTTWPKHAGLMISVVNQEEIDRDVPRLLALKAKLGIPWVGLSMEPLLGTAQLTNIDCSRSGVSGFYWINALTGEHDDMCRPCRPVPKLDWIIVGGESGPGRRPMHPDWVRSIRDQCSATGVPFLFKQWGEFAPFRGEGGVAGGWFSGSNIVTKWEWWAGAIGEPSYDIANEPTRDAVIAAARRELGPSDTFQIIEARSSEDMKHEAAESVPFLRTRNHEIIKGSPL